MRISFVAVLAVALLVGLGAVAAVRALGLLSRPAPVVVLPPPAPTPLPPPLPMVLIGTRPFFPGDAILPGDLGAREVNPSEIKDYRANPDLYLTPIPQEAYYRFVTGAIPANRPLLKSDIQEIHKPEPLAERLLPGTRAVNVTVTKDQAAGGLIQRNDWVDVYLLTNVARTDDPLSFRRQGLLVRNARVVATRDSLFPLYFPNPSDEVHYTLCTNPYRAALLEYARALGTLVVSPVSDRDRKRLDELAREAGQDAEKALALTVGDPTSVEGMEELARVRQYSSGEFGVGAQDLARALSLKPIGPPAPVPQPVVVEVLNGVNRNATLTFPTYRPDSFPERPAAEYLFTSPAAPAGARPAPSPALPGGSRAAPGGGSIAFPKPR